MRELPETRYATSGELSIAYQVMGSGAVDAIVVPGVWSHLDYFHDIPGYTEFMRRLGSFARVIAFDKRGQGLSDRIAGAPALDERMDDIRAVMQAAGSSRAAIVGVSEGAALAVLFAATFPNRVSHLILYGGFARFTAAPDYPFMPDRQARLDGTERTIADWGTGISLQVLAPQHADDREWRRLIGRAERNAATPGNLRAMVQANTKIDVRPILAAVRAPTLVLHRANDPLIPVAAGRHLADSIPGARFFDPGGQGHLPFVGDPTACIEEIAQHLLGHRELGAMPDSVLATVLFTDIVGSTGLMTRLGDAEWRRRLDAHDRTARAVVQSFRGRLVKTTGDGILATFDGPARAVLCALALRTELARQDLAIRAGLHIGEIATRGDDVSGAAVHVAARIQELADAGQVLVSRTLADLTAGTNLRFGAETDYALKGLPGRWTVFPVEGGQP